MSVVKTDDVDPVDVGGEVAYTVTVRMLGLAKCRRAMW